MSILGLFEVVCVDDFCELFVVYDQQVLNFVEGYVVLCVDDVQFFFGGYWIYVYEVIDYECIEGSVYDGLILGMMVMGMVFVVVSLFDMFDLKICMFSLSFFELQMISGDCSFLLSLYSLFIIQFLMIWWGEFFILC